MRVLAIGAALAFIAFLSGCAVTVDVPANRFDSPETLGKRWRVKVQGDYGGENSVVLTPYLSSAQPNTKDPQFLPTRFVRVGGGVEFFDNFDVELRSLLDLHVKYQLLGDPRLTAKQGNFALAVTGTLGTGGSKDSYSPLFGSTTVRSEQNEVFFDGAIIAGYRVADPVLLYAGPFARYTDFHGTFETTDASTGASSGVSKYSGNVVTTGANLGAEVGTPLFQLKGEVAYANVKSGSLNTGRAYAGISLAFQFGKK